MLGSPPAFQTFLKPQTIVLEQQRIAWLHFVITCAGASRQGHGQPAGRRGLQHRRRDEGGGLHAVHKQPALQVVNLPPSAGSQGFKHVKNTVTCTVSLCGREATMLCIDLLCGTAESEPCFMQGFWSHAL